VSAADDRGAGQAGRPVLAVSVEPGRLAAGLVDRSGNVLVRDRVATPTRDVWRALERLVGRVRAAAPDRLAEFSAVGVSCVGPVDVRAGAVSPPHIPAWTSFPLRERIEAVTRTPVVLDTAGAAAAEAERSFGEARGIPSFLSVLADGVVDSACVIDGVRLQGSHGNAGSIAHIIVDPGGQLCWCGARGCLDASVSAIALEAEMNRPLRQATPSIVDRTGIMLGRAIASFAAMVDVSNVFVSGSVVDAFGDAVLDACRREVRLRAQLASLADIAIVEPVEHIAPLVAASSLVTSPPDRP